MSETATLNGISLICFLDIVEVTWQGSPPGNASATLTNNGLLGWIQHLTEVCLSMHNHGCFCTSQCQFLNGSTTVTGSDLDIL